jgi:arylsulfatase
MVSYLDRDIGRIVDLIDELGLSQNTLILFTSDNGPTHDRVGGADSDFFESSGPLRGRKGSVYEGGIRVPLLARWPGKILPGREPDHVAAFWDMLPTLCEVAHIDTPTNLDGISFAPTLFGDSDQAAHEFLYWEFPAYLRQQAVRTGHWKAVRSGVDQGDSDFELYDLSSDIGETRNVASQHPDVIKRITEIASESHVPSKAFPLLADEKRD